MMLVVMGFLSHHLEINREMIFRYGETVDLEL
jgi:hypothetical protein